MNHRCHSATVKVIRLLFGDYDRFDRLYNRGLVLVRRYLGFASLSGCTLHDNVRTTRFGFGFRYHFRFNKSCRNALLDRIRSVLKNQGIQHALIDVGELGALGRKSADEPWQSGVQHPRQADAFVAVVPLDDRCLATSGDYATTFTRNREHHHILDARTGRSPLELASASILAPTGMLADGLSTASFILGAEQGRKLVNQYENVDALFITKDGRQFATPGFPALEES